MNDAAGNVLYISYNGISEPLVTSQVLSYLRELSKFGYSFLLVTFERESLSAEQVFQKQVSLNQWSVTWKPIFYNTRNPLGLFLACIKCFYLAKDDRLSFIHARSFIPAIVARMSKAIFGKPFVNDIRGFWVDEKVYKRSISEKSLGYILGKKAEKWVYKGSDAIVSLTYAAEKEISGYSYLQRRKPPISVIPTCVDLDRFHLKKQVDKVSKTFVLGYVGSLSDVYMPKEIFEVYEFLRRHIENCELKIISNSRSQELSQNIDDCRLNGGVVTIQSAPHEEVAGYIASFDLALCFIKPGHAKIASSATKVGEYLAVGVPAVCNAGIGDIDLIFENSNIGVLLEEFSVSSYHTILEFVETSLENNNKIADSCRAKAVEFFSLNLGVERYLELYQKLETSGS